MISAVLTALHRYPVKGLSPEPLKRVDLETSGYFPGDRLYAVENGPSGFSEAAPRHQPKVKYLMLMRDEGLATLRTRYDDATATLRVEGAGAPVEARLGAAEGRAVLEDTVRRHVPGALRGEPRVLTAPPGYRFTDSRIGYVSILNLASVAALEDWLGRPVDPLRFRMNLHVTGWEPWAELDAVGRVLEGPGGLRLKIIHRTQRCAAVNVDPVTGERDLDIPRLLDARLGHRDCGVYAEVIAGGPLSVGEALRFAG